jgi:hypothetical protein
MVVATILGLVVVRFYKDSFRTYSMQEQVSERDMNAHFVVTRIGDVLQQSGSGLPDSGWNVITLPGGELNIGVNPRGAEHFVTAASASSNFIAVSDASMFTNTGNVQLNTTHVLVDYTDPSKATTRYAIDAGYNSLGFRNGIKDNATGMDSIRITSAVSLGMGDRIFGYREDRYVLSAGNLIVRPNGSTSGQMVLAENIDSLGVTFRDAQGRSTTSWPAMRSASISVRARTARPDPKLPAPGYRKVTLPMNIILRSRI